MKTTIEMAGKAFETPGVEPAFRNGFWTVTSEELERFAELVRADEREVLAQPEQEPVARVIDNGTPEGATEWIPFTNRVEPLKTGDLLYGEPLQRTWVGLTHEEHMEIMTGTMTTSSRMAAVEAKLKEKNT